MTHGLVRLVTVGVLLALSACITLGPDYEEPDAEWVGEWQTNLYGQVGSPEQQPEPGLHFWWHEFDDPVLNELIDTAKRENPTLCIAGLAARHTAAECGKSFSPRRKLYEGRHS